MVRLHQDCCDQISAPQYNRDLDILGKIQWRGTKMIRGLEHLFYKERLRQLGPFNLEKKRLWEDLITIYQ